MPVTISPHCTITNHLVYPNVSDTITTRHQVQTRRGELSAIFVFDYAKIPSL